MEGWKPLDREGVVAAASSANERNPALDGNGAGKLLCVYENVADGKAQIVARTLRTRQDSGR